MHRLLRFRLSCRSPVMVGFLSILLLLLIALGAVIWKGSTRLITPRRVSLEERHQALLANPAEYGLDLESVEFHTKDGLVLRGLIATQAKELGTAVETREMKRRLGLHGIPETSAPRGTIFLLHGRGGKRENLLWVAKRFVAANFRCVVYDARAHGDSDGNYTTFGKHEVNDLHAIIDQTRDRLEAQGESLGPACLFGNSLGAAVCLQAMPQIDSITATVAVAPFTNLPEVVYRSGRRVIHSHFPVWLSRSCLKLGGWRAGFDPYTIRPIDAVSQCHSPLFLVHGRLDQVIPIMHSEQLREASQSAMLKWNEVETGYHGNVLAEGGNDLYEQMILFYLYSLESTR